MDGLGHLNQIHHFAYIYCMSSIVINPKDSNEFNFIKSLLEKLGVESRVLSDEDIEDLGMSVLMKDVDKSDRVPESEVIKKLKGE
jgi:hypothetical protein